ncbi:hypothetical protein [Corynebacterium striatum]|uniref:hypothetical protein n=1 Tax=Corynebacterium striatum TaxID=43770 RepID=UPI003B5B5E33
MSSFIGDPHISVAAPDRATQLPADIAPGTGVAMGLLAVRVFGDWIHDKDRIYMQ